MSKIRSIFANLALGTLMVFGTTRCGEKAMTVAAQQANTDGQEFKTNVAQGLVNGTAWVFGGGYAVTQTDSSTKKQTLVVNLFRDGAVTECPNPRVAPEKERVQFEFALQLGETKFSGSDAVSVPEIFFPGESPTSTIATAARFSVDQVDKNTVQGKMIFFAKDIDINGTFSVKNCDATTVDVTEAVTQRATATPTPNVNATAVASIPITPDDFTGVGSELFLVTASKEDMSASEVTKRKSTLCLESELGKVLSVVGGAVRPVVCSPRFTFLGTAIQGELVSRKTPIWSEVATVGASAKLSYSLGWYATRDARRTAYEIGYFSFLKTFESGVNTIRFSGTLHTLEPVTDASSQAKCVWAWVSASSFSPSQTTCTFSKASANFGNISAEIDASGNGKVFVARPGNARLEIPMVSIL